jgi:hypothetical protein
MAHVDTATQRWQSLRHGTQDVTNALEARTQTVPHSPHLSIHRPVFIHMAARGGRAGGRRGVPGQAAVL